MKDGRGRSWALLACAVALSGLLVAGAFNPAPHTGGDNAGYLSLAFGLLTTGSYNEVFDPAGLPHTKYPPVFPAILAVLMWLGARTWVAFKVTAALSTVSAVAFTYLWAARRIGARSALAVAVLLAASSAVVYYSHWILSDPVFVAFTMAALWSLEGRGRGDLPGSAWLASGVVLAGLAYFTRSAGLPLVLAILGWLALRKRWRALVLASVGIGAPALVWFLRGVHARGSYSTEFWMVDPYDPALGRVGVLGLAPRVLFNSLGYVLRYGPSGITGGQGAWVTLLGVVLTSASLYGWIRTLRVEVGPAELFAPLYAGLILLWPEVWAGDRFVLPLYPLVFFYAAVALGDLGKRLSPSVGNALAAAALLLVLLPALGNWVGQASGARDCAHLVRAEGPFACYGSGVRTFAMAAEWSGHALPEGAAVLSRKPRIFYVLSGVRSRIFPFDDDPQALTSEADALGATYVLVDEWERQAIRYVGGAVVARPGAFCAIRTFSIPGGALADLLGILPPAERDRAEGGSVEDVFATDCPPDYVRGDVEGAYADSSSASSRIPLLDRLDP